MSHIITKSLVNHKSIWTVGILRMSNFGQFLLSVRSFSQKTMGSPHNFVFYTWQGTSVSYLQVQLLKKGIYSKFEPAMRFWVSMTLIHKWWDAPGCSFNLHFSTGCCHLLWVWTALQHPNMPAHALSDCQKKKIDWDLIKECIGKTVEAYCQELLKGPEICSVAQRGLHGPSSPILVPRLQWVWSRMSLHPNCCRQGISLISMSQSVMLSQGLWMLLFNSPIIFTHPYLTTSPYILKKLVAFKYSWHDT